jgi:hypothetical protein
MMPMMTTTRRKEERTDVVSEKIMTMMGEVGFTGR